MTKLDDLVWCEKYRPQTIEDCILPDRIKKNFVSFVKKKTFPSLLLSGGAGTGKTSAAKAMCNQLGYDFILINASDERNLDVVRTTIKNFASVKSIGGNKKAIILDECDSLTDLTQKALRAAIEEHKTVSFILTCNYKNKLIPALKSRTTEIDFQILSTEKKEMMTVFLKRVFEILELEHITYDRKSVAEVVKKFYPDNRRILNELQRYSASGVIDSGILISGMNSDIKRLVQALSEKDLKTSREWLVENSDLEAHQIFQELYTELYPLLNPDCIPQFIIILQEHMRDHPNSCVPEINYMALFCRLMMDVQFK